MAKNTSMKMGPGLNNNPDEAALIGMIIARWNAIEDILSQLFGFFAGLSPFLSPRIFGALQSGKAKIDLVELVGNNALADDAYRSEFEGIIKNAKARHRQRNKYAHAVYGIQEGKLFGLWRKEDTLDPTNQRARIRVTQASLRQELNEAEDLFRHCIKFHNSLWEEMPLDPDFALFCISQAQRLKALHDKGGDGPHFYPGLLLPPESSEE